MNKRKRTRRRPLIFMIVAFVSVLLYLTMNNIIYIGGYVRDFLYYPFRSINSKNDNDFRKIFESEIIKENEELKDLMNVTNNLSDALIINATVITRNTSEWLDFFAINKGENDGIERGMAVIGAGGLIGKIKNVNNGSSVVELVTNSSIKNKTSVKVLYGDESVNAIMESNEENRLVVTGISKSADIKIGDAVVTSGLSGKLPEGIIIGHVETISYDNYKLSKNLYVKPVYPLDDIRYVAVIVTGEGK